LFESAPYFSRLSSIKPSCSRTELYGNPLKQKRRCSNIPGRFHQSPTAQLAQELKSVPVDWAVGSTAIGTNSPCDDSPAYLITLLDAASSAAAPAYYYYYYCVVLHTYYVYGCV